MPELPAYNEDEARRAALYNQQGQRRAAFEAAINRRLMPGVNAMPRSKTPPTGETQDARNLAGQPAPAPTCPARAPAPDVANPTAIGPTKLAATDEDVRRAVLGDKADPPLAAEVG